MEEIVAFLKSVQSNGYPAWLYFVMLFAIIIVTQVLKTPIKAITNKIGNEGKRKRVNVIIMLIPYGLAIAACAILAKFSYPLSWIAAVTLGTSSQTIYSFGSKLFRRYKKEDKIKIEDVVDDFKQAIEETSEQETIVIDAIADWKSKLENMNNVKEEDKRE